MRLVAYGAQDIYLTGNPQITFFKVVYRRHTNFSMECIKQTFTGTPDFGNSVTATISRNGDLVSGMYVVFDPQKVCGATRLSSADKELSLVTAANVGFGLIKQVDLEIGSQRIDRQFGKWMNVWSDLTQYNPSRSKGYLSGRGHYGNVHTTNQLFREYGGITVNDDGITMSPIITQPEQTGIDLKTQTGDQYGAGVPTQYQRAGFNVCGSFTLNPTDRVAVRTASVPLEFWFCRNPGLALPLIALQYHEVKVKLDFVDDAEKISQGETGAEAGLAVARDLSQLELWTDYIYLDTDERRRFAQVSHEYLIEQVQLQSFGTGNTFSLNFNHPVKELIWCGQPHMDPITASTVPSNIEEATNGPSVPGRIEKSDGSEVVHLDANTKWTIKLNGHERFALENQDTLQALK